MTIDVAAERARQDRLRTADRLGVQPRIERAGVGGSSGGGSGGGGLVRFRIVELDAAEYPDAETTSGDWFICRRLDAAGNEIGSVRPRTGSPPRGTITQAGDLSQEGADWETIGVVVTDKVEVTDAENEDGDPVPAANGTYSITSVSPTQIRLTDWPITTQDVTADFKVGPNTTLVAKPWPLRRTPHDTVAVERTESPPRGTITGVLLTASGVNFEALGVLETDRVQIIDATQVNGDGETVDLQDDTWDISAVSGGTIDLEGWPHGEFVTDCRFRVGPAGGSSPRNGVEYLYYDHVTRLAQVLEGEGDDPGRRERQIVTPDLVVGDEVYATAATIPVHEDDDASVLWLAIAGTRAWAQRDV